MALDQERFRDAQRAFAAGDYRAAAEGFLASAGKSGETGSGEAFHMAGNALMRLRKFDHAVTVYTHAMRDDSYPRRTAVMMNLGAAQSAQGHYGDAIAAYDVALAEPGFPKRVKALQGRAGVLYKMGRFDEAARDYREAAGDPANPDRGKAFNNLGLSLVALGKPAEAVDAYKASLATDGYAGKGKAAVNLGLAYAALGMPAEAVRSFEMAVNGYGHQLSDAALDAYHAAKASAGEAPAREVVEGWRTGEMQPVALAAGAEADLPAIEQPDSRFFTVTESEMKEIDRESRRQEREQRRAASNPWARAAAVAAGVVLLVAVCAGVFFAGYGWPTQRGTVEGMLADYKAGRPVTDYWVATAAASDVTKEMATIPARFGDFTVTGIEQSTFNSKVTVTIKLDKGAPLHYRISLGREGLGWKVFGVDNDWGSQGGS